MGFMEGLASGFSNAYQAGAERRATAKRDAFQVAYQSYMNKKSTYDKDLKEDQAMINAAKQMAASVGAPEGAWEHAYQRMKGGDTFANTEKWMTTATFASKETPAAPDAPATPDQAAQAPGTPMPATAATPSQTADQQMADSGLAPGQEATTGQQNPDILGSVAGAVGNLFNPQAMEAKRATQANDSVARAAGESPESMAQINAGYAGPELTGSVTATTGTGGGLMTQEDFNKNSVVLFVTGPDGTKRRVSAVQKAPGQYTTFNGQPVDGRIDRELTEDDYKAYVEAAKFVSPVVQQLGEKKDTVVNVASEAMNLADIVEKHPNVLTVVGPMSQAVNDGLTNLTEIFNATGSFTSPEYAQREADLLKTVNESTGGLGADASAYAAYNSARIKFAFAVARANAGPGVLSNQDVQNAYNMFGTADKDDYLRQVKQYVSMQISAFDREAAATMQRDVGVEIARTNGIPVDGLFGPITESLDEETRQFLTPSNPAATATPEGGTAPEASVAVPGRVLTVTGTNMESLAQIYPDIKQYEGQKVYLDGTTLRDSKGNVIANLGN